MNPSRAANAPIIQGSVEDAPESCPLCGAPHERTPSGWLCRRAIAGECTARLITAQKRNRKTARSDGPAADDPGRGLTSRQDWIVRMREAGGERGPCWRNFADSVAELTSVASLSTKFTRAEKQAAVMIESAMLDQGGATDALRAAFRQAYKVLGAPGDFGYDRPEGRAMQAVYECWNAVLASK